MAPRSFFVLALLSYGLNTFAQTMQANFNQVINLNGDMNINSIQFPDGSRIETFSQSQRQMLVNQNQAPLPGNQVTGSTGNPFMQLSTNSLIIQTNGGTDLVGAQIELAMNTQTMQQNNINPDNTFVAKLSPDRRSWMIMEGIKSVNATDNTVRLVKMNQIDGEYIALGRQTRETGLSLTQFGLAQNNAFNVSGSGIQENEFTDGFRMSVRSTQPMIVNTNVVNGISSTMLAALPPGTQSVNNYRYLVNTNLGGVVPNINRMVAVVQLPINPIRLQTVAKNMGAGPNSNIRLSIAQRGILINPGGAQGIQGSPQKRQANSQQGQQSQVPNGNNTLTQPQGQNNGNLTQSQGQNNNGNNNQNQGQNNNNNNGQNNNGQNNNGQNNNGQNNNGQNNNGNNNNNQGQNNNGNNNNNQGSQTNNNPAATRLLLSPTFTPIAANAVLDQMNGRLAIPVGQLDGEYIITVQMANGQQAQGQGQQQGGQLQGQGQGTQQGGQLQGQGTQQGGQIQGQGQQEPQGQQQGGQIQGQGTQQGGQIQGQGQGTQSPQGQQQPQGANEPQAQSPQGQSPAPQAGSSLPPASASAPAPATGAGAAPASEIPPPAVAGTGGAPASVPNAAAVPSAPAPATPARPVRRQLDPSAAAPAGGYVDVSMAWINMMAAQQMNGLPINVANMMDSLLPQGQTGAGVDASGVPPSANAGAEGANVAWLLSGLKARTFVA